MLTISAWINHSLGESICGQGQWTLTIQTNKVSNSAERGDPIGFRYSHKIQSVNTRLPTEASWIENGSYYVFQPYKMRHIGHFAESINHILLKLRYPSFYPPFTDLYIPKFSEKEYEWSKTYLQLVLSLFPENLKPAVHLASSIPISPTVCFRSAVGQWTEVWL